MAIYVGCIQFRKCSNNGNIHSKYRYTPAHQGSGYGSWRGDQKIVLTNSEGKTLEIPFKVIALPILSSVFPNDFEAGSTVTITGNNLDDVSEVVIDGTTDAATIVSKAKKQLVITMPASEVISGKLKVTNLSGFTVSTQVFTNISKAVQVFTDNLKRTDLKVGRGVVHMRLYRSIHYRNRC